jgi:hypothetical protein
VAAWEYAQLILTMDPGEAGAPVTGLLKLPDQDDQTKLKVTDSLKFINRLGLEGWEIVGPPISQNAVFTYKSKSDVWHDRAYWVERVYWFKRPVSK